MLAGFLQKIKWLRRQKICCEGRTPQKKKDAAPAGSFQLSDPSCVSMSTRQMGHFLLVASHWSTQTWWNRCIQGKRLKDRRGATLTIDSSGSQGVGQDPPIGSQSDLSRVKKLDPPSLPGKWKVFHPWVFTHEEAVMPQSTRMGPVKSGSGLCPQYLIVR